MMHSETIPELTARVRQLVAEQTDRKNILMFQSRNERSAYAEQSVRNALISRIAEPLYLEDIQFAAQVVMWATGEILTLEDLCEMLFKHAESFIEGGFFTRENIDSLNWAYQARRN
jgi:hypothetical protein